jgi:hypothetical protein
LAPQAVALVRAAHQARELEIAAEATHLAAKESAPGYPDQGSMDHVVSPAD